MSRQNTAQAITFPRLSGDKYQRILDAAVSVIAERGFHAARVSDIASRAGVADGTVYLYFKNKEEILTTAINTAFDAFVSRAKAELAHIDSPAEKLRRFARMHLEALGANRDLAVVFQMELRQSTRLLAPFSQQHMVDYFSIVRGAIREGQERGMFRSDIDEKIAANCFFGSLDEMVTSWVLSTPRSEPVLVGSQIPKREYFLADAAISVANVILGGLER